MLFLTIIGNLFLWQFLIAIVSCEHLLVNTNNGPVKGVEQNTFLNKKCFLSFNGIPYARPPIDDLRFRVPEPAASWSEPLATTKDYKPSCLNLEQAHFFPQAPKANQSEDCLYLNVYTPVLDRVKTRSNLDVMFFIHGGAFSQGDGSKGFFGPDLVIEQNVVLVTINYRLGPFGFANYEEDGYTGNMGFKDQQLALKWVKENIKNFGGNPDSITVTGVSTGGTAAHLHALSPVSSKLFKRGIALSGSAFNFFVYYEKNNHLDLLRETFKTELAGKTNGKDILEFMKTAPAELIVKKTPVGDVNGLIKLNWGVVVENTGTAKAEQPFLTQRPHKIYETSTVNVEMLFGMTSAEYIAILNPTDPFSWVESFDYSKIGIPFTGLSLKPTDELYQKMQKKIYKFYFGNGNVTKTSERLNQYVQMQSDSNFVLALYEALRLHNGNAKTYCYHFDVSLGVNFFKKNRHLEMIKGMSHYEDVAYLFRVNVYDGLYNEVMSKPSNSEKTKTQRAFAYIPEFFAGYLKTGSLKRYSPTNPNKFECAAITNDGLRDPIKPRLEAMLMFQEVLAEVKQWVNVF